MTFPDLPIRIRTAGDRRSQQQFRHTLLASYSQRIGRKIDKHATLWRRTGFSTGVHFSHRSGNNEADNLDQAINGVLNL